MLLKTTADNRPFCLGPDRPDNRKNNPNDFSPSFIAPIAVARKKKQDVKKTYLPTQLQASFSSALVPRLWLLLTVQKPWDLPKNNNLKSAWSSTFTGGAPLDLQLDIGAIIEAYAEVGTT